jgi:DNA modification methylase
MKLNHIYEGDVLEVLKSLPTEAAHCVVTSPPYWGLRDYSACDCAHFRVFEGGTTNSAANYRSGRPNPDYIRIANKRLEQLFLF